MNNRLISLSTCLMLMANPFGLNAKQADDALAARTEQKIRLMSEALSAKDRGDYTLARERLEALIAVAGNDPQLQLLLNQLKQLAANPERARQPAPPPTILPDPHAPPALTQSQTPEPAPQPVVQAPSPPPAPAESLLPRPRHRNTQAPTDLGTIVKEETDRQTYFIDKARHDLWYVRRLADEGRHAEALQNLASVGTDLPTNPRTLPLQQEISATRVDLEHRLHVSTLNAGAEPPRLSLVKDDISNVARSSDPLAKKTLTLELQMLELSGGLIDDFWIAWRLFSDSNTQRSPSRIHQSIMGRTHSLFVPGNTPSRRQMQLLMAFRLASPRIFNSTPLPNKDRSLGFIAFLDAAAIVRVLSTMHGCQVLGAPRWDSYAGQAAQLTLTPEQHGQPEDTNAFAQVGWQIRVAPQLGDEGRSVLLDLQPRITRYAGFIPSAGNAQPGKAAALSSVYSTYELRTRVQAPIGATLVLTGLEWQQSPSKAPAPGSIAYVPMMGDIMRAREMIEERSELLVFLTTKTEP